MRSEGESEREFKVGKSTDNLQRSTFKVSVEMGPQRCVSTIFIIVEKPSKQKGLKRQHKYLSGKSSDGFDLYTLNN